MEENIIDSLENLQKFVSNLDNTKNTVYTSKVPEICKTEPCLLGIDEAGRGPVLGPMVYGIAYCPISKTDVLESLKCEDSKALTEEKREKIIEELMKASDTVGWSVDIISPQMISNSMLSRNKISLNQVSMDSAIGLIRRAVEDGVNIAEVYVDTVGPPEKYQAYLSSLFPDFKITVAKKADSTYPIVSAASICAKVTRDCSLQNWQFDEGLDVASEKYGSGYPGDPATKSFLSDRVDEIFGFPHLVRFSWSTAENILEKSARLVEWEDVDEENSSPVKSAPITSFFKPFSNGTPVKRPMHKFFNDRCLERTCEL